MDDLSDTELLLHVYTCNNFPETLGVVHQKY